MILYFDSSGELIQMLPHVGTAENATAPRQQSALTINLYFDTNNSLVSGSNKVIWLRYKIPGQSAFSSDCPMTYAGEQEFESFENELVGKLEDGETYKVYSYSFTGNSAAVSLPGIVNFAFTIYNQTGTSPSYTYSDPIKLSNAKILIQETLGLEADSSIGMTPSEYQNLMAALNPVIGLKQTIDAGTGEFTFSKIIASQIFKGSSEISTLFAAKDGSATQDFKVKDLTYYKNDTPQSLISRLDGIQDSLNSLANFGLNPDLNSWIESMNALKAQFESFMTETSADDIINTLSEIRDQILATSSDLTNFKNTLSSIFTHTNFSKIAVADNGKINVANLKSAIETVVDDMYADVSEVEY